MVERRLRQANLFNPTGFISTNNNKVIELSQRAFANYPGGHTTVELGGRDVDDADHIITETLIRNIYHY
jgi:salicylate 5-hydroxylase large subunit